MHVGRTVRPNRDLTQPDQQYLTLQSRGHTAVSLACNQIHETEHVSKTRGAS